MTDTPTLYAEERDGVYRSTVRVGDGAVLTEWVSHIPDTADLDALWGILPRLCDSDVEPHDDEPYECQGRGWLYPPTPEGTFTDDWHRSLRDIWRARGILDEGDRKDD